MKRFIIRLSKATCSTFLLLALAACTAEPPMQGSPADGDVLRVSLVLPEGATVPSTRATADENRIDKVVVLVFDATGSKLETVKSIGISPVLDADQTQWVANKTLLVGDIVKPTAAKRIYVMANWTLPAGFAPDTYTETKLKAEFRQIASLADINGSNAYPIAMSGSKEVTNLAGDGYKTEVFLTRLVAKVSATFTVSAQTQNNQPNIRWEVDRMKISVRSLPTHTFVVDTKTVGTAALPAGSTYFNFLSGINPDTKPAAGAQPTPPAQATQPLVWSTAFYTPENPVVATTDAQAAAAHATYLMVQMPYTENGVLVLDNYYLLYLKESTVPTPANPYKVVRNCAYSCTFSILGKGSPFDALQPDGNIASTVAVAPWHLADFEVQGGGGGGGYFNVSRTQVTYFGGEAVQTVHLSTDKADWQLVERKTNTVVFDFANNVGVGTEVTQGTYILLLTGTPPKYEITVTQTDPEDGTKHLYNFKAGGLTVPFSVVTYKNNVNDNSVIHRSILAEAGWPAGKLPPNGLQIATRGDKVQPGDMPEKGDKMGPWKTEITFTPGTVTGLGTGKGNTDAMIRANVAGGAQHTAANYCREMGAEWYLPSKDELVLIHENHALLGNSYLFGVSYWTSSEFNETDSWVVQFDSDTFVYNSGKTKGGHYIRCVRNI